MYSQDDWDPGHMMNGNGNGMTDGGVWMMVFFGLLFVVLAVAAIFWAIKATGSIAINAGPSAGPVAASPREVLDMRLARGEISAEEYGNTKTLLGP